MDAKHSTRRWGFALVAVVISLAAFLRIRGAQNGLWLDEIWSLVQASRISSALDVFDKIHHDNNHYLNTLYLYLVGFQGDWPGYRIPSVLAGIGSVALAGLIGRARGRLSAFLAMFLVGFSYVLVLYSSEARGYSLVVFFSFLSYYLMSSYLTNRRWPVALGFSLSACLGFLSHLTFAGFFLSAFLWTACRLVRSSLGFKDIVWSLVSCYALPTLLIVTLYDVDIRFIQIGGGMKPGLWNCYADSLAWVFGMLPGPWFALGLSVILFALAVLMLWREDRDALVFFVSSVLVAPLVLAWGTHSEVLYVRYFIVPIAFFLILLGFFLASLYQRPGYGGKIVVILVLAGYAVTNGSLLMTLFEYGRGNDREALSYMLQNTEQSVVTIGGDQDFRIGTVIWFYTKTEPLDKSVQYCRETSWPPDGVDWLVCQKESLDDLSCPPQLTVAGHSYGLARIFPATALSGLHWFVYHRLAP